MTTETHDGTALADELLKRIGETVGDKAKVSTVFGEPVKRAGITVIPVAKARFGFGGGGVPERVVARKGQEAGAAAVRS